MINGGKYFSTISMDEIEPDLTMYEFGTKITRRTDGCLLNYFD